MKREFDLNELDKPYNCPVCGRYICRIIDCDVCIFQYRGLCQAIAVANRCDCSNYHINAAFALINQQLRDELDELKILMEQSQSCHLSQ